MSVTRLDLCFKGNRDYVHGTDIFGACLKHLTARGHFPESIDMSIHSMTRHQLCILSEDDLKGSEKFPVIFKYYKSGRAHTQYLKEVDEDIKCKYQYNENEIEEKAIIDLSTQSITLSEMREFTEIEKIVALNKALVKHLFTNVTGKWVFTRLKLSDVSFLFGDPVSSITLTLKRNLNFQLTDSIIGINGKTVGNIYFTMI